MTTAAASARTSVADASATNWLATEEQPRHREGPRADGRWRGEAPRRRLACARRRGAAAAPGGAAGGDEATAIPFVSPTSTDEPGRHLGSSEYHIVSSATPRPSRLTASTPSRPEASGSTKLTVFSGGVVARDEFLLRRRATTSSGLSVDEPSARSERGPRRVHRAAFARKRARGGPRSRRRHRRHCGGMASSRELREPLSSRPASLSTTLAHAVH